MSLENDINQMRNNIKAQMLEVEKELVKKVGEEHVQDVSNAMGMILALASNATMLETAYKMKTDPEYKKEFLDALEEDDND
jgi:hypothetical protein